MTEGLETGSLLAKRLWAASQATHTPPWVLLGFPEATEAWLDWTVTMSTLHPPGSLRFERTSDMEGRVAFQRGAAAWDDVLSGAAAEKYRSRFVPRYLRKAGR